MTHHRFKYLFILFLTICIGSNLMGQKTDHHWAFGYKGLIKFENGKPQLAGKSVLVSSEGTATVSDDDGNLLFYTDGDKVYGKDNQLIKNGADLGSPYTNATQSSLIIKKPGSTHLYYIFTTGPIEVKDKNFYYNILDMEAQGGKGEVIERKRVIFTDNSTEKLAAISHTNGVDVWVLTQKHNAPGELCAYLLTKSGVSDSVFSIPHNIPGYTGVRGGMTIDRKGEKVVVCYESDTLADYYKFDRSTGKFTFQETLFEPNERFLAYSSAFSADGSKLYIGARFAKGLHQFDMNAADIASSKMKIKPIDSIEDIRFCAPLLGPDDKIYVAGFNGAYKAKYLGAHNWLGIIDFPEKRGNNCSFTMRGMYVDTANTVASMSYSPVYIPADQNLGMVIDSPVCPKALTKMSITNLDTFTYTFEWEINGSPVNKDSSVIHYAFTGSGSQTIRCKVCNTYSGLCTEVDTVIEVLKMPELKITDREICDLDQALVILKRDSNVNYSWYPSGIPLSDSNWVMDGMHIWEAENICGGVLDTFTISKKQPTEVTFYNTTICGDGDVVVDLLDYKSKGVKFYWPQFNDSSYYKVLNSNETTTYQVFSTQCDSSTLNEFTVTRNPQKIWVPSAFTPNGKGVLSNETFKPFGVYYPQDYKLEIYNRWGEKLFESTDLNISWDGTYQGKPVQQDRYFYVLTARNCKNDRVGLKGELHLMR